MRKTILRRIWCGVQHQRKMTVLTERLDTNGTLPVAGQDVSVIFLPDVHFVEVQKSV